MIHTIDLHYHAGQERAEGVALAPHLQHARLTGRKILGLTDHLGKYLNAQKPGRHYAASVEGLRDYRADMDAHKDTFPDLTLFFAPEIGPKEDLAAIPDPVIDSSDFFIGEVAFPREDRAENTEAFVSRMTELRAFSDATGREIFVAHPFRSAVNLRLIKRDAESWVYTMNPRWNDGFSIEELNTFFLLDLEVLADAATTYRLPLEINGNTQFRIRSSNLPAALQMLGAAYVELQKRGVEFVPGSDQHNFQSGVGRIGGAVPADCFHALGIDAEDIHFLQRTAAS